MPATTTVLVEDLARKAFAVVVNMFYPEVFLDAGEVDFTEARLTKNKLHHRCVYTANDGTIFEGYFYYRNANDSANGTVCIGSVVNHGAQAYEYPCHMHKPQDLCKEYQEMKARQGRLVAV